MNKEVLWEKDGGEVILDGDLIVEMINGYQGNVLGPAGQFIKELLGQIQIDEIDREKCTCEHFHEGNCTKSNFFEYEELTQKFDIAMKALTYVSNKCAHSSTYFKDPDIQKVADDAIIRIEGVGKELDNETADWAVLEEMKRIYGGLME